MAQLQVEIVNVSQPVHTPGDRGGYNSIEVAYKEDGKIKGKTLRDFAERGAYNALRGAATGSFYNVEVSKNAKGYSQWDQAEATVAPVSGADTQGSNGGTSSPPAVATSRGTGGRVTGSNYETPEERATKQAVIVRQAMLNAAIEYHQMAPSSLGQPEENNILATARMFEDFVYTDVQGRAESFRACVDELKKTS